MSLREAFEAFRKNKDILKKIHEGAIHCFEEIEEEFSTHRDAQIREELSRQTSRSPSSTFEHEEEPDIAYSASLAEKLYTQDERQKVLKLLSEEPSLMFVGQTNSGKSSIINEFLGVKRLPTSDEPCTTRIVRMVGVNEGEVPCAKLLSPNGQALQEPIPLAKELPHEVVELPAEKRKSLEDVNATVVASFDDEFLKSGVNIIDSPGTGENQVLDGLVQEQLANVLPFVIYVVDGRNLLTAEVTIAIWGLFSALSHRQTHSYRRSHNKHIFGTYLILHQQDKH